MKAMLCDGKMTHEMIRADDDLKDLPVVFLTAVNTDETYYKNKCAYCTINQRKSEKKRQINNCLCLLIDFC